MTPKYTLRRGKKRWKEKDWVITDMNGKPVLGLSRHDLGEIEHQLAMHRQLARIEERGVYDK